MAAAFFLRLGFWGLFVLFFDFDNLVATLQMLFIVQLVSEITVPTVFKLLARFDTKHACLRLHVNVEHHEQQN